MGQFCFYCFLLLSVDPKLPATTGKQIKRTQDFQHVLRDGSSSFGADAAWLSFSSNGHAGANDGEPTRERVSLRAVEGRVSQLSVRALISFRCY